MQVDVIPNIPGYREHLLTYAVPDRLVPEIEPGKRVLVPLGARLIHGYIWQVWTEEHIAGARPVVEVLDAEPLVSKELMNLALWIWRYYVNPPARTIKAMIPPGLEDDAREYLVPGEFVQEHPLFDKLKNIKAMHWNEALKMASLEELLHFRDSGQLRTKELRRMTATGLHGQFKVNPELKHDDLEKLSRKAPRQAALLRYLMKCKKPVDERELTAVFPATVLQALVGKGLVVKTVEVAHVYQNPLLSPAQQAALDSIEEALDSHRYSAFLLFGVTGSGKTEVYLRAVEKAREQGRQSIILVPEIGLTEQIIDLFRQRLGYRVSILHSRLTDYERALEWMRVKNGEADVVIGARSAVFAPCSHLGLVIIDEEQEVSFRQEEIPRYDTRLVAEQRCRKSGAVLVLGSATPSVDSFYRAETGSYRLLELPEAVASPGKRKLKTIDMRREIKQGRTGPISLELTRSLQACTEQGNQAILFLNRRGHSPHVVCGECGYIVKCGNCEVGMVYHHDIKKLLCHYCGREMAPVKECPDCRSKRILHLGTGTQKIEQVLRELLPQARIERMDVDSTKGRGGHRRIMEAVKDRRVDILIGTQMVAKGFDFPGVSTVGVVNADPLLSLPDFRARERAFQLLVQVAGRAGRGGTTGYVLMQTYNPDDPIFAMVEKEDYRSFYQEERKLRSMLGYPPFSHIVKLGFSGPREEAVREEAEFARSLLEEMTGEAGEPLEILGPAPCVLKKLSGSYRYQILQKGTNLDLMRDAAKYIIDRGVSPGVRIEIDIDPLTML